MFGSSHLIFLIALLCVVAHGQMSVDDLARCIMSEASIGNIAEQIAIGFACQRNPNHAKNQEPTEEIIQLAYDILAGNVNDPTQGANRWYSPISMLAIDESSQCKEPIGTGVMDCSGGFESICNAGDNYKPRWAVEDKFIDIPDVQDCYFRFFKL